MKINIGKTYIDKEKGHKIFVGHTLGVLKNLPSNSVDTIITSPPYWSLRDYGNVTKVIWDGDKNCKHKWETVLAKRPNASGGKGHMQDGNKGSFMVDYHNRVTKSDFCSKCGAWYGQLGLEPTLDLFIKHLLQITSELKRVLKPTGVMFWNHGDCYLSGNRKHIGMDPKYKNKNNPKVPPNRLGQIQKCLSLQNYRLIKQMIDKQGWILRNTIIWFKPNHMPSSVKDRFANSYEPVFMLVKSKKYWFDLDAVRVPYKQSTLERVKYPVSPYGDQGTGSGARITGSVKGGGKRKMIILPAGGRNPGDLWQIPTQSFSGAHFATFPEKLITPLVQVACPQWICKKCGKARKRIVEKEVVQNRVNSREDAKVRPDNLERPPSNWRPRKIKATSWTNCGCNGSWRNGVVLDPFFGAGTTMIVADKLNRTCWGIELNPSYVEIAINRLQTTRKKANKEKKK